MNEDLYEKLRRILADEFIAGGKGLDYGMWDFMHAFANPRDALLFIPLFCPRFLEMDGSILLDRGAPDCETDFVRRKREGVLDPAQLEASFNTLEIGYLFSRNRNYPVAIDELLANVICEVWKSRLMDLFPSRGFDVKVLPANDQTGETVRVQFHQTRDMQDHR